MKVPGIVRRHPELRWLVPLALIVAVAALIASSLSGVFREDSALPVTGPDQLMNQLREPHDGGYSGTILAQVDLGLPEAATRAMTAAAPAGELLRGSHTMRYWYGDAEHQRVAVVRRTSEQDLFRSGDVVWEWDTGTRVARRTSVSETVDGALPLRLDSAAALTPPQLAGQILGVIGRTSETSLRSGDKIDGRPTYELVLRPESTSSRIGAVHIELDGRQGVPLGVQVYPVGITQPMLDVAFTSVSFARPAARNFSFTPPTDAVVGMGTRRPAVAEALDQVEVLGTGWLTIASYRSSAASGATLAQQATALLGRRAQAVKGTWGKGELLQTPAMSVLVTDKGRVLAGPVAPDVLYRAAG